MNLNDMEKWGVQMQLPKTFAKKMERTQACVSARDGKGRWHCARQVMPSTTDCALRSWAVCANVEAVEE